jgi:hypothetical protein
MQTNLQKRPSIGLGDLSAGEGVPVERRLNTESEFDADINVAGHLDDLGELDRLLGSGLQIVDGEDLEAGVVEL